MYEPTFSANLTRDSLVFDKTTRAEPHVCPSSGSGDVKDFLSYLALKRRVSSSTQNQAFNALLFLFREVLERELGDLSKTVRAKRGQRLPVTLSPEKVQELFKHVNPVRNDRALAPPSIKNEHFLFTYPS